ncbi:hypothetical protein MJO52_19055 [Microbulbifer variabilis]|uniref:TnsA endonuclease N-terminal domain-containing protein n=1 Tax=Microbulbifer variabilis TaxID=266805 RepID=A0ABY4VA35_9GAMM|nr:hypothetical protein [Microbulbifer variabilis]USD21138.1 hypothetical protein MJO52_19055 [Microbulbifer variabilis]
MRSPARKLKKSAVKNIVRFPAIKSGSGKSILVESILESKYCLHLEFDSRVKTYFPQPRTFSVFIDGEERKYTPDFEVHYVSGACKYVEVKPLEHSQGEWYQKLFSSFEASLENPNISFLLVDEMEITRQPLLSNYEKLYQYRKRPIQDMRNLYQCAESVGNTMLLSRMITKLKGKASLREIYSWLALGYLKFDISSEHLKETTEVTFDVC